jgi:hypothetical protein
MYLQCCHKLCSSNTYFELKGFKLEGTVVSYSTRMYVKQDMRREQEYIPVDSVEQRVLTEEQAARLEQLTDLSRFARRIVAKDKDWRQERQGSYDYWVLKGECERFIAHKIGPAGRGAEMTAVWQEITDMILGEGGAR